jgi:hypothetical protein
LFDRDADGCAKRQVCAVNALWLAFACLIWLTLGPMALVKVQLPIALIGSALGVWLFYFQHHYPDAYFARHEDWDFTRACTGKAARSSSCLRWLQFFSGNIGVFTTSITCRPRFRTIASRRAMKPCPSSGAVAPLTLRDCAEAIRFALIRLGDRSLDDFPPRGAQRTRAACPDSIARLAPSAPHSQRYKSCSRQAHGRQRRGLP